MFKQTKRLMLTVGLVAAASLVLAACGKDPTPTPVPPTATPTRPPTATSVPPTATPVPPTATPVPPTATPTRPAPTATPVPPTATARPPTATAVPPTPTPAPTAVPTVPPPATGEINTQSLPHRFYGSARAGGQTVADGTIISAVIENQTVGTALVTGGNYRVDAIQRGSSNYVGKRVTFFVGAKLAAETGTFEFGGLSNVNLTTP